MFGFVFAQGWEVAHYSFCDRDHEKCVLAYKQAAAGMVIARKLFRMIDFGYVF